MKKIMIVDDEEDQILGIKKAMEKKYSNEYEIIPAHGGEECLKLLKNSEMPDLILLDIMMPEMSGWVVFDMLKAHQSWKDIPLAFLSAREDDLAENAGKFLSEDFIRKPVYVEELKKRIDKVLKK